MNFEFFFLDPIRDPICDPIRDPIRDPVRDPIRDSIRSDPGFVDAAITAPSYKQPSKLSQLQNTQLNLLTVTFLAISKLTEINLR